MLNKKAEMGVGTLIIFIAMLLVAAVAAGVLIQTAGSLQEKSLATGQQARSQISTNARVIEVSGTDGRNQTLNDFTEIIKLSPGSDPIKLSQVIFTFNTKDKTSTLKYRGTSGICTRSIVNGYYTLRIENITTNVGNNSGNYTLRNDYDDDHSYDYMYVGPTVSGETYLYFNFSDVGLLNVSLGTDISNLSSSKTISLSNEEVKASGASTPLLYVSISGTISSGSTTNVIPGSINFTITPYNQGDGYFVAVYEQEGTNHIDGNLQRGDIIKLCFESPAEIEEDDEVRLNFIPKIGTPTLTQFVTPDVMSTERVYLYP